MSSFTDTFTDLYIYLASMNCSPLTQQEIAELDSFDVEEDIATIAEKLRSGDYGGEYGGEMIIAEDEESFDQVHFSQSILIWRIIRGVQKLLFRDSLD